MKREDRELETKIAEAVRAAGGARGRANFAEEAAAILVPGRQLPSEGEGPSAWWGSLQAKLEGVAAGAVTARTQGWQGIAAALNPIFGSLLRFLGKSGEGPSIPMPAATKPTATRYELGFGGGEAGMFEIDRDASGAARVWHRPGQPTVIVNVDTIDSRSFLERTPEIAEAVRRAVLEAEGFQGLFDSGRE